MMQLSETQQERMDLARGRLGDLAGELQGAADPAKQCFASMARFLQRLADTGASDEGASHERWEQIRLYDDYDASFASYRAKERLNLPGGICLIALYAELASLPEICAAGNPLPLLYYSELVLLLWGLGQQAGDALGRGRAWRRALYDFYADYAEEYFAARAGGRPGFEGPFPGIGLFLNDRASSRSLADGAYAREHAQDWNLYMDAPLRRRLREARSSAAGAEKGTI